MKFSEKLKTLREARGYTQDEIASKLNIARQSVSKWEQGINEPDFETVKKLCQILDCSISELIDDDHEVISSKEEKRERIVTGLFKASLFVFIFSVLFLFAFIIIAPDQVAYHYDMHGGHDLGSKWLMLLSILMAGVGFGIAILTKYICKKKDIYKKYNVAMQISSLVVQVILLTLFIILSVFSIKQSGQTIPDNCWYSLVTVALFSVIVGIAPLTHSKWNKRNPMFGFRTNFTLSNEEAWNKVNAFTSIVFGITGLVGYVLTLIFIKESWNVLFVIVLLIGIIIALIYHEVLRHKMK